MPDPMSRLPFARLPYKRPNLDDLVAQGRRSRLILRIALSQHAAENAVLDFDAALTGFKTMAAIAHIRHDQSLDDAFYMQEQAFFDETAAQVLAVERQFNQSLLKSRHAAHLGERFGSMLLIRAENSDRLVNAKVQSQIAEENRLASRYEADLAEPDVRLNGARLSLSQLGPYLQSPDRDVRRSAHLAVSDFFSRRGDRFDQTFDQLVKLRDSIARGLGFRRFTELGYRRMERFDYGREQVESFREAIERYIVPMTVEIRRLQRRRLGVDRLFHYDLPCLFPFGNPVCQVEPAKIAQTAERLFVDLFGQAPSFFTKLSDRGFLDLVARPNKTGGGYCETVHDAGLPFILMNASDTPQDVTTLMHESGHAYASMEAFEKARLSLCHSPSLDVCEIHSTALEYLSYPLMTPFFGEDAEDYTLMHMTESLLFLPYACQVDEYQHRIYDEPDLRVDQRHEIWRELERKYQPYLEYEDDEYFEGGRAWHKKAHIFVDPFYYIDYAIAQVSAMELWMIAQEDKDDAISRYTTLCRSGGTAPFGELLRSSNISSPFSTDTIKKIAYKASQFLEL